MLVSYLKQKKPLTSRDALVGMSRCILYIIFAWKINIFILNTFTQVIFQKKICFVTYYWDSPNESSSIAK